MLPTVSSHFCCSIYMVWLLRLEHVTFCLQIFVQRSWTSVRVMSVEKRTELFKCVANDDLQKRRPFKECFKISKDLNLTLEQVSFDLHFDANLTSYGGICCRC